MEAGCRLPRGRGRICGSAAIRCIATLRVYALDPNVSRLDGAVATVAVPYEPLAPGPSGALFEVVDFDATRGRHYAHVNLEEPFLLMEDGRNASAADPLFHQQMVYAVASRVYFSFKLALGRDLSWGFARSANAACA